MIDTPAGTSDSKASAATQRRTPLFVIVGASLVVGALIGGLVIRSPASHVLLARANGAVIQIEPSNLILNSESIHSAPSEPIKLSVQVTNITPHAIRIVGANTSCQCLSLAPLPMTLPPHGDATFSFQLRRSLDVAFVERVRLFTDPGGLDSVITIQFPGNPSR